MRFGLISHQRANNWDKAAEIPLVSIVTSAVRLPANILLLCLGIINLRKKDKELAKSQIRASFIGMSKAIFGMTLPLISNIFIVCVLNKNKYAAKTLSQMELKKEYEYFADKDLKKMSKPEIMWYHALIKEMGSDLNKEIEKQERKNEKEESIDSTAKFLNYNEESLINYNEKPLMLEKDLVEVNNSLKDEIANLIKDISAIKDILDGGHVNGMTSAYCSNVQKDQFYQLFDNIQALQELAPNGEIGALYDSERGEKLLNAFNEVLDVNGSFQIMLRVLEESPEAAYSTLAETGRAILIFLEQIKSRDSEQAKLLARGLDKFSDTIINSKLCKTIVRNEFQRMHIALHEFAKTDNLYSSFEIWSSNRLQSTIVLSTFKEALTPAEGAFQCFQHTVRELEKSSNKDELDLAKEGRNIIKFLEQLKTQKKI